MPKTFVPQSLIQSVVLALLFATLSACGGGGGGVGSKQPTPTPTPTPAPDTSPNNFSFEAVTGAQRGEVYTASVTVSGINTATPVSIEGGLFAIGEAELVEEGQVTNGQSITVQVTASDQFSTESTATLTVGDKSADFTVTTEAQDLEPEPFTFEGQTDAEFDTAYISSPITVSGINDATPISIESGEFEIDGSGDEFTPVADANATVNAGQTVRVRVTSADAVSQTTQATITIGNQTGTFSVTTFADTQAPVAEIAFPPPMSMTAHTELTVRGTVTDDYSDVAQVAVLINGADSGVPITPVEDEANPGVYNWSAQITLTEDDDHTVIVTTMDSAGNINSEAASVMVTQGSLDNAFPNANNPYGAIVSGVLDFRGGQRRLLTVHGEWDRDQLLTVTDLDTGERIDQILIDGLLEETNTPFVLELDKETGILYTLTFNRTEAGNNIFSIAAINPATGELAKNAETNEDLQPFVLPGNLGFGGIVIDRSGVSPRLLFSTVLANNIYQIDLDLDPDSFAVFSDADALDEPWELLYHEQDQRLFVTVSDAGNILELDLNDGDAAPILFSIEGDDEGQHGLTGMDSGNNYTKAAAFDHREGKEQIILSGLRSNILVLVDLATGHRTPFSDQDELMRFDYATQVLTHSTLGYALVTDLSLSAVFAVDLESGERVIISKSHFVE